MDGMSHFAWMDKLIQGALNCQRSSRENLSLGRIGTRAGANFPFFCARLQKCLEHIARFNDYVHEV